MSDRGFYLINALWNLVNVVFLLLGMLVSSVPFLDYCFFFPLLYCLWASAYWFERYTSTSA